jgi:hypothetical protein
MELGSVATAVQSGVLVGKDAIVSFHSVAQQDCSRSCRSGMVCGSALNQTKKQLAAARLLQLVQ